MNGMILVVTSVSNWMKVAEEDIIRNCLRGDLSLNLRSVTGLLIVEIHYLHDV